MPEVPPRKMATGTYPGLNASLKVWAAERGGIDVECETPGMNVVLIKGQIHRTHITVYNICLYL
jgi:hypothetical protein